MAQTNTQRRARTQPRARMAKQRAAAGRLWAFRSRPHVLKQRNADLSTVEHAATPRVNPNPFVLPRLTGIPASRVLSDGAVHELSLEPLALRMLELGIIPPLEPHRDEPFLNWLKRAWKTSITRHFDDRGTDLSGSTILQFDIGIDYEHTPVFALDCAQSWYVNLRIAHERFAPIHQHALASMVSCINGCTAPLWSAAIGIEMLEGWSSEGDWDRETIDKTRAEIAEEESMPLEAVSDEMAITSLTGMTLLPSTVKAVVPEPYHSYKGKLSLAALKRLAKSSTDLVFCELVRLTEIAAKANKAHQSDHLDLEALRTKFDGDHPSVGVCGFTADDRVCLVRESFEENAQMSAQESGWQPLFTAPTTLEGVEYLHKYLENGLPGLLAALKFLDIIEQLDNGRLIPPYTMVERSQERWL